MPGSTGSGSTPPSTGSASTPACAAGCRWARRFRWPSATSFTTCTRGGQLFDPGPVADSFAGGPGLVVEPPIGFFDDASSVEAYLMWSKHVPDRADPEAGSHGHGLFVRAAAEKLGWRGHFIFWSGCLSG